MTDQEQNGAAVAVKKKKKKSHLLTAKELNFCNEYLIDFNALQAYKRAGYSPKNDNVAGNLSFRLLRKAKVQSYIQQRQQILKAKLEVTQERILREYARIAFLDVSKLYNENGQFKNIHEIDEDSRAAIAGIEVERLYENREAVGTLHKVKLNDKVRALADLATHLGMFKVIHEHSGKIEHVASPFESLADILTKDTKLRDTLGALLESNKIVTSEIQEKPDVPIPTNGKNGNGHAKS